MSQENLLNLLLCAMFFMFLHLQLIKAFKTKRVIEQVTDNMYHL